MMLRSLVLPNLHSSSSSPSLHICVEWKGPRSAAKYSSTVCCRLRDYSGIPYLGTFSKRRGRFDDILERNLPLIDNARFQLSDHCTTLEGEPCFDCWMAVLDLDYLHNEGQKEEVESLIREAGGAKYVIKRISELARAHKMKKELQAQAIETVQAHETAKSPTELDKKPRKMTTMEKAEKLMEEKGCPVPDGIPPTWEELEEMERMKMPDSSFTKLLRYIGGYPSWYVPRPDHETD